MSMNSKPHPVHDNILKYYNKKSKKKFPITSTFSLSYFTSKNKYTKKTKI